MSTWLQDLEKKNPALAADYRLVGNQDAAHLRCMVKALRSMGGFFNTPEDNARLAAAERILKAQKR